MKQMLKQDLKFWLVNFLMYCTVRRRSTTSNAPKIQTFVDCKVKILNLFILTIFDLYFQELQRISQSGHGRL